MSDRTLRHGERRVNDVLSPRELHPSAEGRALRQTAIVNYTAEAPVSQQYSAVSRANTVLREQLHTSNLWITLFLAELSTFLDFSIDSTGNPW